MSNQSAIIQNYSSASKAWYPTPSDELTGTLTSTGKTIKGTGTAFGSQLSVGDYLLNAATDDLQKIARIESDTLLYLEAALTTPITDAKCRRIKNKSIRGMQIVFTAAGGTIRGASQATGVAPVWPASLVWRMNEDFGMDPQLVTPASGTACVTVKF